MTARPGSLFQLHCCAHCCGVRCCQALSLFVVPIHCCYFTKQYRIEQHRTEQHYTEQHHTEQYSIVKVNKRFILLKENQAVFKDLSVIDSFSHQTSAPASISKRAMDEFRWLFLQWIICCHIALAMVENPFFRALINFINRVVLDYLPESSTTVRKWVMDEYKRQKKIRKEALRRSRSRINISFDTWTSPFCKKHVITVIAHFVDENWERRHLQLNICRLYGGHSGANLAAHILPILSDWGINDRIGYFITDNEASNGTTIDHIIEVIEPTVKKADRRRRWIRCLAHTLNLTV